jgi:hypothetical protein
VQPVFVDTFYWIALLNPDDPDHDRVTAFDLAPERPPLVTTEEVLTEFLTYFSGRGTLFRRKAAAVAYALRDDPDVRLLPQTSRSFAAGCPGEGGCSHCFFLECYGDGKVYLTASLRLKRKAAAKVVYEELIDRGSIFELNNSEIYLSHSLQSGKPMKESVLGLVKEWCEIWEQVGGLKRYLPGGGKKGL